MDVDLVELVEYEGVGVGKREEGRHVREGERR